MTARQKAGRTWYTEPEIFSKDEDAGLGQRAMWCPSPCQRQDFMDGLTLNCVVQVSLSEELP